MLFSPVALITPALSHPGVIIYAIAARDKVRATAFAHQYKIPVVKDSYEGVCCGLARPDLFPWTAKNLLD